MSLHGVNMPIYRIKEAWDGITVWKTPREFKEFQFASIRLPNGPLKAEALAALIQEYFDKKIDKERLPTDDPDRRINPDTKKEFWKVSDVDGKTYLVSRTVKVFITWTGRRYKPRIENIRNG